MNRILLIPVAGTIAAFVAIAMARGERDHPLYPIVTEPTKKPPPREVTDGPPEKPDADTKKPVAPVARRYLMEVLDNGGFRVTALTRDTSATPEPVEHESMEKFLETAAPEGGPKPTVHVFTTSPDVTAEDLEKVAAQLRERCDVKIQKR